VELAPAITLDLDRAYARKTLRGTVWGAERIIYDQDAAAVQEEDSRHHRKSSIADME
jgi:hypothetical protein